MKIKETQTKAAMFFPRTVAFGNLGVSHKLYQLAQVMSGRFAHAYDFGIAEACFFRRFTRITWALNLRIFAGAKPQLLCLCRLRKHSH